MSYRFGYNEFSIKEPRLNGWLTAGLCVTLLVGASFPRETVQVSPQSLPNPTLKITPAAITFPPQPVDTLSPPQTIMITSSGSADLQIRDILTSGIDFAETSTCGTNLAAGASCTIAIACKPAISGPRLGTVSIVTSDPGGPRLVPLSGAGK